MAYTKKTNTSAKVEEKQEQVKEEVIVNNVTIQEENDVLKLQLAEMKAQMEMLMKQVAIGNSQQQTAQSTVKKDRNITFVNMTKGTVVLRGTQIWTIEGQFNSRVFSEKEATVILDNMNKCIRSGVVYINDADFIKEHELEDAYRNIVSAEELKTLFEKDSSYVINAYKMASEEQQKIIISMIVDKKMNKIQVDGNVLVELSNLSGRDLFAIEPLEDE